MRHRKQLKKLGRPTDHRVAMLKNQVTQLFLHGKLTTTEAKAKVTKRLAERALTKARGNDLHAKREIRKIVNDPEAFKKIFEEYVPKYASVPGGYLSIIKLPPRRGDGSDMALLRFTDLD